MDVYADKDWQSFGTVKEDGNLYADGTWNFNTNDRGRVCQATGTNSTVGNYYTIKADPSCPFPSGNLGQLVMKSGNTVTGYGICFALKAGQSLELRINDGDISDNAGSLQLRFVPSSVSQAIHDRVNYDSAGAAGEYWIQG
ncbi:hypothetical protein [Pseudomonas sp. P9_31]|uniref:hypothetical protein n=1 Tax=Pseudomonas sp. P9_31 TaxID=3043448 RepID=UPI002A3612E6|nr:hypothetical protein [Pseudomonas sp. P9_31]WPN55371.1 hypothetical protein QMK51_14280 [Pseudomonas sp. P9_31]